MLGSSHNVALYFQSFSEALDRPKKIPNELDGEALLKENKLLQMKCQEMETENKRYELPSMMVPDSTRELL